MTREPGRDPGEEDVPERLDIPDAGSVRIVERIASGKMTEVYRGDLDGRPVALKIYRPAYVRRHAERHPVHIAEYEFERNAAFRDSPELSRYVAEPLGYVISDERSAFLQELVDGELYYDLYRRRGAPLEGVMAHLHAIVRHAHERGLYDIDLHAMNVLVVEEEGEEIPKLFDFNRIPFYMHPRNPVEALALRLGVIDERTRDRKKLRQFHDFRKLLRRRAPFMT